MLVCCLTVYNQNNRHTSKIVEVPNYNSNTLLPTCRRHNSNTLLPTSLAPNKNNCKKTLFTGPKGYPGRGSDSIRFKGLKGIAGPQGEPGRRGANGLPGVPGRKGATGDYCISYPGTEKYRLNLENPATSKIRIWWFLSSLFCEILSLFKLVLEVKNKVKIVYNTLAKKHKKSSLFQVSYLADQRILLTNKSRVR